MKGKCSDKNRKIVTRIFCFDGKFDEFELCKQHSKDPDFSDFISETPINKTSNSEVLQN